MVRRKVALALTALIAGAGCHAGTSNNLAKQEAPLAKESLSKSRIIETINKNASTIQSLKATPKIQVSADGHQASLSGNLAMERPKDFRLVMKSTISNQADIGSNDQGFWFWVKDNKDKAIYVCDYEHVSESPLTVTMQPDWIIEAMGLREISEREAATISARGGEKAGTLVLTQFRKDKDTKGETLTKETIVDEVKGTILEHRLYSGAKKELLAKATILDTKGIRMSPTDSDPDGTIVTIPSKLRLEWIAEKFSIELTMATVQINPTFAKEVRAALFTEPPISGANRVNLAAIPAPTSANSSRIYESMPMPRSGVQLGQPEADPTGDDAVLPSSNRKALKPVPPSSSNRSLGVIGPQVPRGSDSSGYQLSTNRNLLNPVVE